MFECRVAVCISEVKTKSNLAYDILLVCLKLSYKESTIVFLLPSSYLPIYLPASHLPCSRLTQLTHSRPRLPRILYRHPHTLHHPLPRILYRPRQPDQSELQLSLPEVLQ